MNSLIDHETRGICNKPGRVENLYFCLRATIITAITIFVAHHLSCLLHEWTHDTVAWLFGYKKGPFDIYYGDWTLLHVDEDVDYKRILSDGRDGVMSLIAIAPIILGGVLLLIGVALTRLQQIQRLRLLWYFLFWFMVSNLGQVLDYIPIRTFVTYSDGILRGDIGHFVQGLHISPWAVFFPGTVFVVAGVFWLLRYELPRTYVVMGSTQTPRTVILAFALVYLFFYFGMAGWTYSFPSRVLGLVSLTLIPVFFIICFPTRDWVKQKVAFFERRPGWPDRAMKQEDIAS
jgi:hypothetical protein